MRIALLSDSVHTTPLVGGHGLGWIVYNIAERLHARGHDVTMFAAKGSQFSGKLVTPCEATLDWSGELLFAKTALEMHKEQPFDVFFCNGHLHALARFRPDLPIVNAYHDKVQDATRNAVLGSEGLRSLMLAEGKQVQNARVARYQFDRDEFEPCYNPQPYALFLGSMFFYKQPLLAIEACARLRLRLVMVGGYGEQVFGTNGYGKIGNTHYMGMVTGKAKLELIRNAVVLVHPGNIEACPIVDIESMLSGTPIAAWAAGGHLDLIQEGVNGSLMDLSIEDKVDSLCEAILRAMRLNRYGVRAYGAAYFGNPDVHTEQLEQALCDVISGVTWG